MTDLSIIVPVYNEELTLVELRDRLFRVILESLHSYSVEVLFINDGSVDSSLDLLREFHLQDPQFKFVTFSRNFGHQAALLAGLRTASGDAVVVMDADLQDPPELIPELVEQWKLGFDVVYAQRKDRRGESIFKRLTASFFYRVINWLSETDLPRNVGDFRLMDRRVIDIISASEEKSLYLRGLGAWVGFKQCAVEFDRDARFAGETKYSLKKMINLAADAVLSFSEKPLRVVTRLGIIVTALSFLILIIFFASLPFGSANRVPGWLSTVTVVLVLGGVQLICLGIVGEYVSRIYREVKNRPLYIIDDRESNLD
jgi:dolichol-phosphate mannosyltransferase